MITSCTLACAPSRKAMLARISAVQHRIGGVAVDRGVARAEADVFRPELSAERQPFLVDQRLDWAGVNGALPLGQGLELHRRRDQRFPRTGRRVQNDVLLLEQLQDRRFLRGIKMQPAPLGVFEKPSQQHVIAAAAVARDQIIKRRRHTGKLPPAAAHEKNDCFHEFCSPEVLLDNQARAAKMLIPALPFFNAGMS